MPTQAGKPTRKEKSEANKAAWSDSAMKARALTKYEKDSIALSLREETSLDSKEKFIEAVKLGLNLVEATKAAGIGIHTVYDLIEEDKEFNKSYTRARDIANELKLDFLQEMQNQEPQKIVDAQGNMIYDVTELKWRSGVESIAKWVLSVRDPKRFGNNSRLQAELTGKDGAALGRTIVVTEKELNEAKARLEEESK